MSWICPFCERELLDAQTPCCGEAGHAAEVDEEAEANLLLEQQAAQAAQENE